MRSRRSGPGSRRGALFGGVALTAALALGLSACGSSGSSSGGSSSAASGTPKTFTALVAAAKKEGSVNLYVPWADPVVASVKKAFKAAYGITINATVLPPTSLETRVLQEQKGGVHQADVVVAGDPFLYQENPSLFVNVQSEASVLPAMAQWPKAQVASLGVNLSTTSYYVAYNKNLVKGADIPKNWTDLLTSKFKGKVLFANPANSSTQTALYLLIDQRSGMGTKFLKGLISNGAKSDASSAAGAQIAASGEKSIVFPAYASHIQGLSDMALATMPYTTGAVNTASVFAKSAHPDAALLLLDWMMTKPGVTAFAGGATSGGTSLGPWKDIAGMPPLPTGWVAPDYAAGKANQTTLAAVLGLHD